MKSRRAYPESLEIKGETYNYEKILKEDFFSINVLYRAESGSRYVLKMSDFRFILGFLLTPFAILMSRREYRIYSMVADLQHVPELGPRLGMRGYLHKFVEGRTLHELEREGKKGLPDDFFDRLKATVEEIHLRRIFYMDLNKAISSSATTDCRILSTIRSAFTSNTATGCSTGSSTCLSRRIFITSISIRNVSALT